MSQLVLRLLLYMYTENAGMMRWDVLITYSLFIMGVKQGGLLSLIFFSVYLNKKGVHCHMGNYFLGFLAYADDFTFIAPSRKALQIMINICEAYSEDYIIFNGPKSQFLISNAKNVNSCNVYCLLSLL